jgi:hypothetical protein
MFGYLKKIGLVLIMVVVIIGGFFSIKKFYYEPLMKEQHQKKVDKKKKLADAKKKRTDALHKAKEDAKKNKSNQSPIDALKEMFAPSKEPPPYACHDPSTINERLEDYYYYDEILGRYKKAL